MAACAAAAAESALGAPLMLLPYSEILQQAVDPKAQPKPLPRAPASATLPAVLPFLIKLALQERQLWWRAGGALACLVASKSAGALPPWPHAQAATRTTESPRESLVVTSFLTGLLCPLFFKRAVDAFSLQASAPLATVLTVATQCLLLYGACDILKHVAKELQAPLFTPLSQVCSGSMLWQGAPKPGRNETLRVSTCALCALRVAHAWHCVHTHARRQVCMPSHPPV